MNVGVLKIDEPQLPALIVQARIGSAVSPEDGQPEHKLQTVGCNDHVRLKASI
jgi:hypothetical protein